MPNAVGVCSLTVVLAVTLTVTTGVIVGMIAISSSNSMLQDARSAARDNVQHALSSGEKDITGLTARYLHSVLQEVRSDVMTWLMLPKGLLSELAHLLRSMHPDDALDPAWIDNGLRRNLRAKMETLKTLNIDQLGVITFPFSPSHPVPFSWGGQVLFFHADPLLGVLPRNGSHVLMVASGTRGHHEIHLGEADEAGFIANPNASCTHYPDWNLGERVGSCVMNPDELANRSVKHKVVAQIGGANISTSSIPPDTIAFLPIQEVLGGLSMYAVMSVSHPLMLNMMPNQQRRMAYIIASLQGRAFSDILTEQRALPEGAFLYAVQLQRGKPDILIGASGYHHALPVEQLVRGVPYNFSKAIPVAEHTEVPGGVEPSLIAQHSVFLRESVGGYANATCVVSGKDRIFIPWNTTRGLQYWTLTTNVTQRGLDWYINFVVPRASVMGVIEASMHATRANLDASDRQSNENQRDSFIVTMCVMMGVVAVLIGLAAVCAKRITDPLVALGCDMANVAVMNLEAVDVLGPVSRLSEVAEMQQSFRLMVNNLVEYRNYMPQSVLVQDTDDDDFTEDGCPPNSTGDVMVLPTADVVLSNSTRSTNSDASSTGATAGGVQSFLTVRPVSSMGSLVLSGGPNAPAQVTRTSSGGVLFGSRGSATPGGGTASGGGSGRQREGGQASIPRASSDPHRVKSAQQGGAGGRKGSDGLSAAAMSAAATKVLTALTAPVAAPMSPHTSGEAVKRRNVSAVYFNMKGWHSEEKLSDTDLISLHADVYTAVLHSVHSNKGVPDCFSGDRLFGIFNAFSIVASHRPNCVRAAYVAREVLDALPKRAGMGARMSIACGSGEGKVMHLGCNGMKKITASSRVLPWVVALERYVHKNNLNVVADMFIMRDCDMAFTLKLVDGIRFPKRCRDIISVYEVVSEKLLKSEEWMYQLEAARAANPYAKWNEMFRAMINKQYSIAARLSDEVSPETDARYSEILGYIAATNYTPVMFHCD